MASHIPQNNGKWSDPARPGDSVWFPGMDSIPQGSNDPYRPKTFRALLLLNIAKPLNLAGLSPLKKTLVKANILALVTGARGIRFRNNEPDFSPFAIATVKVRSFLDERYGSGGTMTGADKLLAEKLCLEEWRVRQWINDNQYVWHERQDGRRIDLLCHDIHGNIPHTGGISMNKTRLGKGDRV